MSQEDSFNIVVVGHMNPRVHHPGFYRHLELFSVEDETAVLESEATIVTAQVAQLVVGDLRIQCLPDRWSVTSQKEAAAPELLRFAARVMTALEHTPVSAFGLNFDYVRKTTRANLGTYLASLVTSLPLGLGGSEPLSAVVTYVAKSVESDAERRVALNLGAVPDADDVLTLRHNFHYTTARAGRQFDLGKMLRERYERDHKEAQMQLDRTLQALGGK